LQSSIVRAERHGLQWNLHECRNLFLEIDHRFRLLQSLGAGG
jgi:hypothetical protein